MKLLYKAFGGRNPGYPDTARFVRKMEKIISNSSKLF